MTKRSKLEIEIRVILKKYYFDQYDKENYYKNVTKCILPLIEKAKAEEWHATQEQIKRFIIEAEGDIFTSPVKVMNKIIEYFGLNSLKEKKESK